MVIVRCNAGAKNKTLVYVWISRLLANYATALHQQNGEKWGSR
jgi:hypothetical protein